MQHVSYEFEYFYQCFMTFWGLRESKGLIWMYQINFDDIDHMRRFVNLFDEFSPLCVAAPLFRMTSSDLLSYLHLACVHIRIRKSRVLLRWKKNYWESGYAACATFVVFVVLLSSKSSTHLSDWCFLATIKSWLWLRTPRLISLKVRMIYKIQKILVVLGKFLCLW